MHSLVNAQMVEEFQRDGIVLIEGLFKDQVDLLRLGVDKNMTEPRALCCGKPQTGRARTVF